MPLTGAVARLAADVHLGPCRVVGVRLDVIALSQVRRVACRALQVPGLVTARPVQGVVGLDALVGIEVEPPVPPGVPGDGQVLQASAGKRREVLLQRLDPQNVGQLEVGRSSVRALGVHEEPVAPPEEPGGDAVVGEGVVVEVAEDRLGRRDLHGEVVVRAGPGVELGPVAVGAVGVGHVCHAGGVGPARLPGPVAARRGAGGGDGDGQDGGGERAGRPANPPSGPVDKDGFRRIAPRRGGHGPGIVARGSDCRPTKPSGG